MNAGVQGNKAEPRPISGNIVRRIQPRGVAEAGAHEQWGPLGHPGQCSLKPCKAHAAVCSVWNLLTQNGPCSLLKISKQLSSDQLFPPKDSPPQPPALTPPSEELWAAATLNSVAGDPSPEAPPLNCCAHVRPPLSRRGFLGHHHRVSASTPWAHVSLFDN